MYPVLFKIGPVPIHSYGFMLAISFLVGMFISGRRAQTRGIDKNIIMDLAFWLILAAILGARLYYIVLHPEEFSNNWMNAVNPFSGGQIGIGGLVMVGGLLGAVLAGILFLHIKKVSVLKTADIIAPTIGLGICFTRIGCFLNGCCHGKCTSLPWGISFPDTSPAGHFQETMQCEAIHPSQLYLSAGGLAIFLLVLFLERHKKFDGHNFLVFIVLYSILRFMADFTRHYTADEMALGLSHNQVFCILLLVGAAAYWIRLSMIQRQKPSVPPNDIQPDSVLKQPD